MESGEPKAIVKTWDVAQTYLNQDRQTFAEGRGWQSYDRWLFGLGSFRVVFRMGPSASIGK